MSPWNSLHYHSPPALFLVAVRRDWHQRVCDCLPGVKVPTACRLDYCSLWRSLVCPGLTSPWIFTSALFCVTSNFTASLGYQPPLFPEGERDLEIPSVQHHLQRVQYVWTRWSADHLVLVVQKLGWLSQVIIHLQSQLLNFGASCLQMLGRLFLFPFFLTYSIITFVFLSFYHNVSCLTLISSCCFTHSTGDFYACVCTSFLSLFSVCM